MVSLDAWKRRGQAMAARSPAPVRALGNTFVQSVRLWVSEDGTELGASIAFYSMFAMAPLLVIAIAIAGAVFGPDAARGEIYGQIAGLVGDEPAKAIEHMIASAWQSRLSGTAAGVGVVTLLVGASGVFAELRKALNRIGRVRQGSSGLSTFLRARLVAFALVLGTGFLVVASLLLSAALSGLSAWLSRRWPVLQAALTLVDVAVSLGVLSLAFLALLRWLPDRALRWRSAAAGALTSALLFSLGKQLIGLYLGRVSVTSSFGAAGSLVVVLLWVYYSSQILLYGAAVGWTLDGVRAEHSAPP
jgi:membrane protein